MQPRPRWLLDGARRARDLIRQGMQMSWLVIAGSMIAACGVAEPVPASSPEATRRHDAARRGLLAEDGLLAAAIVSLGEADGLWPWFADDAVYLHPGAALITGRAAARDVLRQAFPDRRAPSQRLHRVTGDVSGDAQLGYTLGWFEEEVRAADGTTTTGFGKYLATWRRAGARWQLAGFVRNPSPRAPSPPPPDAAILAGEHGVVKPGDASALRDQAIAADAAFSALSVARGYTVAFTTYGAADAVISGGRDFLWNAAGVAVAWGGWTPAESLAWTPRLGRAAASGDLAFTVGEAVITRSSGAAVSYTKYLTVWIHQADGSWRFLLDAGNPRPAPAL